MKKYLKISFISILSAVLLMGCNTKVTKQEIKQLTFDEIQNLDDSLQPTEYVKDYYDNKVTKDESDTAFLQLKNTLDKYKIQYTEDSYETSDGNQVVNKILVQKQSDSIITDLVYNQVFNKEDYNNGIGVSEVRGKIVINQDPSLELTNENKELIVDVLDAISIGEYDYQEFNNTYTSYRAATNVGKTMSNNKNIVLNKKMGELTLGNYNNKLDLSIAYTVNDKEYINEIYKANNEEFGEKKALQFAKLHNEFIKNKWSLNTPIKDNKVIIGNGCRYYTIDNSISGDGVEKLYIESIVSEDEIDNEIDDEILEAVKLVYKLDNEKISNFQNAYKKSVDNGKSNIDEYSYVKNKDSNRGFISSKKIGGLNSYRVIIELYDSSEN